ncbi:MAG: nucleotide exchange factor GrpE [Myxococcales bacterium]
MTEPTTQGPEKEPAAAKTDVPEPELKKVREDMDRLVADLEARDKRIDELARAYSSLLNDQKDFRTRLEREKDRVLESERVKIALHLLSVGDELERALAAAKDEKGPLAEGVKMIHEGLGKTLTQLGLQRLALVGTDYDPNLAEVIDLVPVQDPSSDGKVVAEIAPGYRLGEKVVRAARVRVSRHVPAAEPAQPQSNGPTA